MQPSVIAPALQSTAVSKEVTFTGAGDVQLAGTLTTPATKGLFPAALLIPGSGPTDRDGNSGLGITTDVLKQIAENLADHGVATLRFDKRAIARYKMLWPKTVPELNKFFSYQNFIDDAKAAYLYLKSAPGVDPSRVAIVGHSEGGLFTLQIASDYAGTPNKPYRIVLLGTCGRTMGPVIHDQLVRLLAKQSAGPEISKQIMDYSDLACKELAANRPLPPNEPAGLRALYYDAVHDMLHAYMSVDPVELAKRYPGPALVINGSMDTQVSATEDAPRLIAAFKSRSSGAVQSLMPTTSHNLKPVTGDDHDVFVGPVAKPVMDAIVAFLASNH